MKGQIVRRILGLIVLFGAVGLFTMIGQTTEEEPNQGWTLVAWNDLGMHCMDEDFSVFSILPPFNTVNAQLVDPSGNKVTGGGGVTLYYEAIEDPDGSETRTSNATNFWEHAEDLFGTPLAPQTGLKGNAMPGPDNTPRAMHWEPAQNWFAAEGIPIIPRDKFNDLQAYPLLRVTARNAVGELLASSRVVAPVSSEMNCKNCHRSGGSVAAQPPGGWVGEANPVREYRLNILKLHDERHLSQAPYQAALASAGYLSEGLLATVQDEGRAILCASCHASNALGTKGLAGVPALTAAIHSRHVIATDPDTGTVLGAAQNTASCYQCHPGANTRCLRGAMGTAFDASGQPSISCQNCHGGLAAVGDPARVGWLQEPNCQSCHTGSETNNAGEVRYTHALVNGDLRAPAENRFATTLNAPEFPHSLYRFSTGHGGMKCSGCHGSPHAVYPTGERNDNLLSRDLQGHVGTISDCGTCHQNDSARRLRSVNGGPHGMHSISEWWIKEHHDHAEHGALQGCKGCHGTDSKGGVLSRALGPRSFSTEKFGTVNYWEGQRVSCYDCHDGPSESRWFRQQKPAVQSFSLQTQVDTAVMATLQGTDGDTATLEYRIIAGPQHGSISLAGNQVAYTPQAGFHGTDFFTYCAQDDRTDSNLATVGITVGENQELVDADGDGISDLLERAFGLRPDRVSRRRMPQIAAVTLPDGRTALQTTYDPSVVPPDLQLRVEVSGDLEGWSGSAPNLTQAVDGAGRITKTLVVDPAAGRKYFMRYAVSQQ